MNNQIIIYDNIFTNVTIEKYGKILKGCPFHYGEMDKPNTQPTGLTTDFINPSEEYSIILDTILSKIYEKEPSLKNMKLFRRYLNLFLPSDNQYFHIDGDRTVTCMVYINPETEYDEGGETQFIDRGTIQCVRSLPGRLVIFDGNIQHRATSFRTIPRLTLIFKFHIE